MNPPNPNEHKYQQQLNRYHSKLLPEFEAKEEINLKKRLDKIIEIVNNHNQSPLSASFIRFQITSKLFNKMLTSIKPEISQHTKVQSIKCEKRILNENDYKKPARNMLNRWKPAILANHVLHHIIFINVYNHCYTICRLNQKDDNEILKLFINIFDSLLSETVKFSQTKPQPLIFHAIFHRDNQFKRACVKFLTHFKVIQWWNQSAKKAEIRFNSFKECLQKINYIHITNAIIPIMLDQNTMSINQHNQPCCIHYEIITQKYLIYTEMEYRMSEYDTLSDKYDIFETVTRNIVEYICFGVEFVTINTIQQRHSYQLQSIPPQKYSTNNENNYNFIRQRSYSDNPYSNPIVRHDNNQFLAMQHRHSTTCIFSNDTLPTHKPSNHPMIQQSHSGHIHSVYNNNRSSYGICPMAPQYQQSVPINHIIRNNRMQAQQHQQQQLQHQQHQQQLQNMYSVPIYNTQQQQQQQLQNIYSHRATNNNVSVGWTQSNYNYGNTNYNMVQHDIGNNIDQRDESGYDHMFMPFIENDREPGMDEDGDRVIKDRDNNDNF